MSDCVAEAFDRRSSVSPIKRTAAMEGVTFVASWRRGECGWIALLALAIGGTSAWGQTLARKTTPPFAALDGAGISDRDQPVGADWRTVAVLEGDENSDLVNVAISEDDKFVACGDKGELGVAWLWRLGKAKPEAMGKVGSDPLGVSRVAFAPKEKLLLVAGTSGLTTVWKVVKSPPERVGTFGVSAAVKGMSVAGDGKEVILAGADGEVRFWSFVGGAKRDGEGFVSPIASTSVAFAPDGKLAASGHRNGEIQLIAVPEDEKIRLEGVLRGPLRPIVDMAFSPDSKTLISTSGPTIAIWTVETKKAKELRAPADVRAVAFAPDGARFAAGVGDELCLYRTTGDKEALISKARMPAPILDVCFASDGRHVGVACGGTTAYIVRLPSAPPAPGTGG